MEVGETVEVGVVMARIATDAKPGEAHASENGRVERGTIEAAVALEAPGDAGELQGDTADDARRDRPARTPVPRRSGPRRYSPVVMRIAAEHGIDLEQVEGTGRGGRVRKQDVLAFVEDGAARRAADAHRVALQARPGPPKPKAAEPLPPRRGAGDLGPVTQGRSRGCARTSAAGCSSRCRPRRRARRSSSAT